MTTAEIALVVLAGVSLLWTVGLVLALVELRQLSARLQEFLRVVDQELRPLAAEARVALANLNQVTQDVRESNLRLQGALGSFRQAGDNVRLTTEAFRSIFGTRLIPIAGLAAGVRAGAKLLWNRYTHRQRRETT